MKKLTIILFCKTLFLLFFIIYGPIGVGPDEAQYWTWSQILDWGYYSKPPGVAWEIWFGTQFFGNTALGVRFGSLIMGCLLPLVVYGAAFAATARKEVAFWAGTLMAITPLGFLSSLLAITDGGMLLFWTLGCWVLLKALAEQKAPNMLLFGLCVMAGALFKWPIFVIWLIFLLLLPLFPIISFFDLLYGFLISLLGFVPSVIWNYMHDWATFRHVFSTVRGSKVIEGQASLPHQGNMLHFLGAQVALMSPIIVILLIMAIWYFIRNRKETPLAMRFCLHSLLLLFGFCTVISVFKKVQGNWSDFAFPTAFIFIAWYGVERLKSGIVWLKAGIATSVLFSLFVLAVPTLQSENLIGIPYRVSPFRHNMGWEELTALLESEGYNPKEDFLFSAKYQTSSLLSFYGPEQKRAYFFNLHGSRKNQFSYWPGMDEEQVGQTGYFVLVENLSSKAKVLESIEARNMELLRPYFQRVESLGSFPLFVANDEVVKVALVIKAIDYNGKLPEESAQY